MKSLNYSKILLLIALFCFFFLNGKVLAQNAEAQPLERILNPDGTINPESAKAGSFDPK